MKILSPHSFSIYYSWLVKIKMHRDEEGAAIRRFKLVVAFLLLTTSCALLCTRESASESYFDCQLAGGGIEHILCIDTDLSNLNRKLSDLYDMAFKFSRNRRSLVTMQNDWNGKRSVTCNIQMGGRTSAAETNSAKYCLRNLYKERIAQMISFIPKCIPDNADVYALMKRASPKTSLVPLGMIIENTPQQFRIIRNTYVYKWPYPVFGTKEGELVCKYGTCSYTDYSICTLRDKENREWLTLYENGLIGGYVAKEDTEILTPQ